MHDSRHQGLGCRTFVASVVFRCQLFCISRYFQCYIRYILVLIRLYFIALGFVAAQLRLSFASAKAPADEFHCFVFPYLMRLQFVTLLHLVGI